MSDVKVGDLKCMACGAEPGAKCTQPTDTGRKEVNWYHLARVDALAEDFLRQSEEFRERGSMAQAYRVLRMQNNAEALKLAMNQAAALAETLKGIPPKFGLRSSIGVMAWSMSQEANIMAIRLSRAAQEAERVAEATMKGETDASR